MQLKCKIGYTPGSLSSSLVLISESGVPLRCTTSDVMFFGSFGWPLTPPSQQASSHSTTKIKRKPGLAPTSLPFPILTLLLWPTHTAQPLVILSPCSAMLPFLPLATLPSGSVARQKWLRPQVIRGATDHYIYPPCLTA
jgi:hypothetical protein